MEAAWREEVLRVQRALDQTQLEIEQVLSRLRTLDRLTEKATITIALREEGAEVSFTDPVARAPSLGAAFRHAVAGFFRIVFAVIVGLGYVLPVAVAVAAVAALGWLVLRRARAPS
jgi:VIT1/CCC1 family predicted Fe2+/Mn2+ transporter